MTWSPKRELVKRSAEIASNKHPDGYNKSQLIEASKEVFGGYGENVANPLARTKPITTMDDVNDMGNAMAFIDGHYPAGMSGCFVVGINGGCGYSCPVFRDKECEELGEFTVEDYRASDDYDEDVAWYYWDCIDDENPSVNCESDFDSDISKRENG